jgi:hypothetical protein
MTTRERRPEERTVPPVAATQDEHGGADAARDAGDAFLNAADAAIDRALSGTPEEFLRQNRQLGGQ